MIRHKRDHKTRVQAPLLKSFFALFLFGILFVAAPANAKTPELQTWTSYPDTVSDGKPISMFVWFENVGDMPLAGDVTVSHTFPAGIEPVDPLIESVYPAAHTCQITDQQSVCTIGVEGLLPGAQVRVSYRTMVAGASGELFDTVVVSGGGDPSVDTIEQVLTVRPPPPFDIKSFAVDQLGADRLPAAQASSAPRELTTSLVFRSTAIDQLGTGFESTTTPIEHLRNATVHVPPGLIGNPNATPVKCTNAQLAESAPGVIKTPNCPQDSQVGFARLISSLGPGLLPLYNLEPPPGSPAAFGFVYQGVTVVLVAKLRPTDHGVDIVARTAVSSIPVPAVHVAIWGVPADPSHDSLRHLCMDGFMGNAGGLCPSDAPAAPFLRLPTSCPGTDLPWSIEADTYEQPTRLVQAVTSTAAMKGCERVPFDPTFSLVPSTGASGAPTGLDVTISIPQDTAPGGLAQADLRRAAVTLPEGMAINPSSATGLASCSDAQLRLGLEGPSQCPDAAKIGTLEVETPLLDHPIGGSVFLRSQGSGTAESGNLYRMAVELRSDDDGINVKLAGSIKVDPFTGRLTTIFDELPQLPFESMQLRLKSGARAPLVNPARCGTQTAEVELTGWNGKVVSRVSRFTTSAGAGGGCDLGFDPKLSAGTENHIAGTTSPFHLRLTRDDGSQQLRALSLTLPPGLSGYLKGIPYCPDAALAAVSGAPGTGAAQEGSPACPAASRVGSATVGTGAGPTPFYTSSGRAYLAGPYKGAPLSLAVVAPAVAGPFDLGSVVVRNAIHVDPITAQLTIVSDPLPTILHGIPLNLRDIRVAIDREHFTVNPTSCEPMSIGATITSTSGATVQRSQRFQAAACERLGFKPRLSLSLRGPSHRAAHPRLRAVLRARPGDANIGKVSVLLPKSELLENAHIRTICTRVQFNAGEGGGAGCPKGSVYGYARAWTPLLDKPLQGSVYLRANGGERELPDLVAALDGQIHIDLVGYIDSVDARIRTRFVTAPDAPVSRFELTMQGGRKGLLANNTNLCRGTHRASVHMTGQNGRTRIMKPVVKAGCRRGR